MTVTVEGKVYNTDRIWGKLGPFSGMEEGPEMQVTRRVAPVATIVRGMLFMPPSLLPTPYSLLSITGRKVFDLHPGPNDVSRLAPGVYFIRDLGAGTRDPSAGTQTPNSAPLTQKIIIAR